MPEHSLASQTACFHCGDPCGDKPVTDNGERAFCCAGCRAVYHLLSEHNLTGYYDRDKSPGIRPAGGRATPDFTYLDNDEIASALTRDAGPSCARVTLRLPQIHCASCIWLLERLPQLESGIKRAEVDFPRKSLNVLFDKSLITLRQLVTRLAELGYEPQINLRAGSDDPANNSARFRRPLYLRLGVSGFAFGNIMLFSFPEYLSGGSTVEPGIARVFGYASLLLALPVMFYSGKDYFTSSWRALRDKALNIDIPIALGIITLFSRSAYEIISGAGAGYLDSLAGLVFFLLVGRVFQEKTYSALSFENDYRSYFPLSALRRTRAGIEPAPLEKLRAGDLVIIRNNELVPADGIVRRGIARLDYSFVTGESESQTAGEGESVYTGGRQTDGAIEVELTRDVSHRYLSDLWRSDISEKDYTHTTGALVNKVSWYFTPIVLLIAAVAFFFNLSGGVSSALNAATAALIIACPCALALTSPFALGAAMRILGSHKLFVKNTQVIERLATLSAFIFDKTGTLTHAGTTAHYRGEALDEYRKALLRSLASQSTHPASRQIAQTLSGHVTFDVSDYKEFPGEGITGNIDNRIVRIGSREFIGVSPKGSDGGQVFCRIDDEIPGGFILPSTVRPGIKNAVKKLADLAPLALLSGDDESQREDMRKLLGDSAVLKFRQKPRDKREHITKLQSNGAHVMMIGDGLNDAGALSAADVGVAVTDNDSGFSPASDIIIPPGGLTHLSQAIELARWTRRVMYAGFVLSFGYNAVGLSYAIHGDLTPLVAAILMPLSSITVVAFSAGLTSLAGRKIFGAPK